VTCIVGVVAGGRVYMGADRAGVSNFDLAVVASPKVFRNGRYLVGYTDSFRMGQILEHVFNPDPPPPRGLEKFMAGPFVTAIRTALNDGGFAEKTNEKERGGCFLVGVAGRLFRIESEYNVLERVDGFDAVGCGAVYALGALHAYGAGRGHLRSALWANPRHAIRIALAAAARFSAGVRGPFNILEAKRHV
jgi:hypothetical protein